MAATDHKPPAGEFAVGGLEGDGLVAQLTAVLGSLVESQQQATQALPRIPWGACHPIGPIGSLAGSGTVDTPDVLGPHDPYWWDLRRFAAWGFTAGTVNLFKNSTSGTQLGSLAAPGNVLWSSQELLAPRDRLLIVASGITGVVQWEVRAIEVASAWLPEYLV